MVEAANNEDSKTPPKGKWRLYGPNERQFIRKIPSWSNLRNLGQSRILTTSYFWIVFVPLAAKFLAKFPANLEFVILNTVYTFHVGLPFSWKVFYFGSLSFAIGTATFSFACPALIQKFDSYAKFEGERGGDRSMLRHLHELISPGHIYYLRERIHSGDAFLKVFCSKYTESDVRQKQRERVARKIGGYNSTEFVADLKIKTGMHSDAFSWLYDLADMYGWQYRLLCATCYGIGFALILYLLVQSTWYVIAVDGTARH